MTSSTWRALGNTYVVVEPRDARARRQRERRRSRADGRRPRGPRSTRDGRVEIAIWNPDGSRAELSGNGTRIAAAWLAARSGAPRIDVVVGGRDRRTRGCSTTASIEQDLGEVVGRPDGDDRRDHRSCPSPSATRTRSWSGDPVQDRQDRPLLETHARFPNRTNVQVARVDGPGEVTARVWERGVGETLSSGTSAVAVAAATHGAGDVLVHFPGGDLRVRLERGSALLYGIAERVA